MLASNTCCTCRSTIGSPEPSSEADADDFFFVSGVAALPTNRLLDGIQSKGWDFKNTEKLVCGVRL